MAGPVTLNVPSYLASYGIPTELHPENPIDVADISDCKAAKLNPTIFIVYFPYKLTFLLVLGT